MDKLVFEVEIDGEKREVKIDQTVLEAIGKVLGRKVGYHKTWSKGIYARKEEGKDRDGVVEIKFYPSATPDWREEIDVSACITELKKNIMSELEAVYANDPGAEFFPTEDEIRINAPDKAFIKIEKITRKKRSIRGVEREITEKLTERYPELKDLITEDKKIFLHAFFDVDQKYSWIEESAEIRLGLYAHSIKNPRLEQIKKSLRVCAASAQAEFFPGALDKFFDGIDEEEVDELIADLAGSKLFNNALMEYVVKKYPEIAKKCARRQVIRNG
jgi:hypothetical protein